MNQQAISRLLEPVLESFGLELDDLEMIPAGKRTLLRVTVDGDGPKGRGPLLDDIAAATRAISDALDASPVTGDRPYTLEVTSRGVSKPLSKPAQWRRNAGRLVAASLTDGRQVSGRIGPVTDAEVILDSIAYRFADMTKAVVQVELNRKPDPDLDEDPDEGGNDDLSDLDVESDREDADPGNRVIDEMDEVTEIDGDEDLRDDTGDDTDEKA